MSDAHAALQLLAADLAGDERERSIIASTLRLMAYAAPPVAPPAALRDRVAARARGPVEASFTIASSFFSRSGAMSWSPLAPGIDVKVLHSDPATGAHTTLVRMAPNRHFPAHDHRFIEDLYLVEGEVWVGDVPMAAGDYCRAEAGTAHNDVRSGDGGALAIVVSR